MDYIVCGRKGDRIMQFYDMHSHILPEFDDGAKTSQIALNMLASLKAQGVTNVCLTPHFYTNEMSVEDFVASRAEAFEKFKPLIPSDFNVVLGAEVYVTRYLFNCNDLSSLTYGNSNYILSEFAYNSTFEKSSMDYIDKLVNDYRLIPVLPHVERYSMLMDNPSIIRELRDIGVIIQSNISNYTKKTPMFKRRKLLKMIDAGLIDILGTDAHSFEHNNPEIFSESIKCISDKCGERAVKKMMLKARIIFDAAFEN